MPITGFVPRGRPGTFPRRRTRSDRLGDLAVARADRLRHAARAGGEVAARVARAGNAREAMRHDLALDEQHALVALGDGGDVALRHDAARAETGDGLDDDIAVRIVVPDAEDAG